MYSECFCVSSNLVAMMQPHAMGQNMFGSKPRMPCMRLPVIAIQINIYCSVEYCIVQLVILIMIQLQQLPLFLLYKQHIPFAAIAFSRHTFLLPANCKLKIIHISSYIKYLDGNYRTLFEGCTCMCSTNGSVFLQYGVKKNYSIPAIRYVCLVHI